MTEALRCPTCSAPLEAPADRSGMVRCPYCQSVVRLDSGEGGGPVAPAPGSASRTEQITAAIRAGKQIEAIRLYRQFYNADLHTAKAAVDNITAGRVIGGSVTGNSVAATAGNFGRIVAIGIIVLTAGIVALVVGLSARSRPAPRPLSVVPAMPRLAMPTITPPPPPPPPPSAFASEVLSFGSEGIGAGQFKDARSVAVDGAGHIYVGEYSNGRVQVFDAQGKFLKAWSIKSDTSLLNLDAERNGTVLAITPGHILCYEGITGRAFGEAAGGDNDNQFEYFDACISQSGDIYAIGAEGHIVILDSDGHVKSVFDGKKSVGENVDFIKVAVNGLGEIYVLDRKKGVIKFAADGHYINRFGEPSGDDPAMSDPPGVLRAGHDLLVDGKGRVYVSEGSPAIRVFDAGGRYLDSFGGDDIVFGLALDDQEDIYASFRNECRVRKFRLNDAKP